MDERLSLAPMFKENCVLQREKPVPVWGGCAPGGSVTVTIQGVSARGTADGDGHWQVCLPPLKASALESLTVECDGEEIVLRNVAVGEVWLLGGQSNMEFWMRYEKHADEVRPDCGNPLIRFYDVPKLAFEGQDKLFDYSGVGIWRTCTPEDIDWFSAVGYYFARALQPALDVPIGLVGCNWGGSTAQAWMDPSSVEQAAKPWMEDHLREIAGIDLERYWAKQARSPMNDTGRPFENPFNNRFLPVTVSAEEAMEFFRGMAAEGGIDTELQAKSLITFPGCLYTHMLCKAAPYALRGVLWYQGESDERHADIYGIVLTRMIEDWRALWGEDFPFLMVQLPGYESWLGGMQTHYREVRRAQKSVADAVEGVYLTSISDAGEQYDIHPKDKRTPGTRLALLARGAVYGEDILCMPPEPTGAVREGDRIRVSFAHAEGGLRVIGDELRALDVFTAKNGAVPFSWSVEGGDLVLEPEYMPPEKICLSFATQLFYLVNLFNAAGIPAVPFELEV